VIALFLERNEVSKVEKKEEKHILHLEQFIRWHIFFLKKRHKGKFMKKIREDKLTKQRKNLRRKRILHLSKSVIISFFAEEDENPR